MPMNQSKPSGKDSEVLFGIEPADYRAEGLRILARIIARSHISANSDTRREKDNGGDGDTSAWSNSDHSK